MWDFPGFSHDFFGRSLDNVFREVGSAIFFVEVGNDPRRANNFMINLDVRDTLDDHVKSGHVDSCNPKFSLFL